MGIHLDNEKNRNLQGEGIISSPESPVLIVVVKANEEEIIARDTYDIAAADK